ncbi:MAG TPA: ferrous iron transport protein A [bacterium]|nr:ferrous iron transport protein A [bacterium]
MTQPEITLDQIRSGRTVRVVRIAGGWGIQQRLNQLGIHPADRIEVLRNGILGGPVLIRTHGIDMALGRGMARHVAVTADASKSGKPEADV